MKQYVSQIESAVLRKREAAKMCSISTATLDRLRVAGKFVRPIQLGEQAIGFLKSDLDEWISSRPQLARFCESIAF